MKFSIFPTVLILAIIFLPSTSAGCGGSCGGCSFIWGDITHTAKTIKEEYLKAEKRMSAYYMAKTLPIEKDIANLDKRITKDYGSIELIQKAILIVREKMAHEIEKQKKLQYLQGAYTQ